MGKSHAESTLSFTSVLISEFDFHLHSGFLYLSTHANLSKYFAAIDGTIVLQVCLT